MTQLKYLDWNRLEELRAPRSLSIALQDLGLFRIELVRRELRQEDSDEGSEDKWVRVPAWLKGSRPFIDRVEGNEVGREILRRAQENVQEESARLHETVCKTNALGLTDICVPLVLGGRRIGFIYTGGFVAENPLPGDVVLEERFRVLMFNEEEVKEAKKEWRDLPHFNADKRAIVIQMLELLAQEIIQYFDESISAKEREEAVSRHTFSQFVTSYPPLRQLLKKLNTISESGSTVLIYGEPGTGRELVARMIHERSGYPGEFRVLHCASIAENLLEAELLGYEQGAFAGAYSSKPGLVELCEGGTLYLKEIGDLSLAMQLKILKLIQDQTYTRVGGRDVIRSNVRLIVSTQRNLKKLVQMGSFREDLYFRLGVVEMELPPLRSRREDVSLLAEHFLHELTQTLEKPGVQWKEEALQRLKSHPFPGNVRELRNEVERVVAMKEPHSFIDVQDLSAKIVESRSPMEEIEKGRTLKEIVDEFEKKILSEALAKYYWNRSRVAELFQITRQGLMKKISKHKLDKRKQL